MISWNIRVLIVIILMKDVVQCLRYNFGDGSYYVGSVDNQGRPSGRGQYHNSSGDLGNFQTYYPLLLEESASGNSGLLYTIFCVDPVPLMKEQL